MIRDASRLFAEKIMPSLFAFSVSAKILVSSGVCEGLSKTPLRRLFPLLGVSASGFSALIIGFLSGFPTGAAVLADSVSRGGMSREEAAGLLPFCNNAGASFVIGTVGILIFDSAEIGRMLFLAQITASLFAVVLTAKRRAAFLSTYALSRKTPDSTWSIFTSAVARGALSMVSVCGYVIFFSVVTGMFLRILDAFLPFSDVFFAFLSGISELSSGVSMLSELDLPHFGKLILCGALLGFGGISVFLQAADRVEAVGISLSFYLKGKIMTMFFSALAAPLFCVLSEMRYGVFGILIIFTVVLTINPIKNKIIFRKSVEKQNGMLYNRNEIQCP